MEHDSRSSGRRAVQDYNDILHMKYPLATHDSVKYPPMPKAERAKIFAPFAALQGFEEAIREKQKELS